MNQAYRSYRRRVLLFTPKDLPNLKLWCGFNQGITVTGAGVSQWDDLSGQGNHLKQGTDANRMTLASSGAVLGNGVDQFLKADAFTFEQPETVYLLAKPVTWTVNRRFMDGNANNTGIILTVTATPQVRLASGANNTSTLSPTLGQYSIFTSVINGTPSLFSLNKGAPVTADLGLADMGGFTLGAKSDGTTPANVEYMEVVAFSEAHDLITRNRMIEYLGMVGGVQLT